MPSSLEQNKRLADRIERMDELIMLYPDIAISEARSVVETATKILLSDLSVEYDNKMDVPQLRKLLNKKLYLSAKGQDKTTDVGLISAKMLGNFEGIASVLDELRNKFSSAHGHGYEDEEIPIRFAQLACISAKAIIEFWFSTFDDMEGK